MHRRDRYFRRAVVGLCVAVFAASSSALIAQTLPTAESLIVKHETALGGMGPLDKHTSLRMTGKVEIVDAGIQGTIEILRTKTNHFVQKMTLSEVGVVMKGYDGTVAWVIEPSGPGLLTGSDADVISSQADWHHAFKMPIAVRGARVDSAEFEGERSWRLTYAADLGLEVMSYFSRSTGLRLGETWTTGVGETTMIESAYKEFAGVKLPTRMTNRAPVGVMVITIDSVEFDRVEPSAVALPAQIRALIKPQ